MKTILRILSTALIGTAITLQVVAHAHELQKYAKNVNQRFNGSYNVHR